MTFTPAGRLIHQIVYEQRTGETQSNRGSITPVWTPVAETDAEVKPLHGRNVEIALMKTKGKSVSHQITSRVPDVPVDPSTTRINFHGRIFEIFSIVNVLERNIELDILANEVVG